MAQVRTNTEAGEMTQIFVEFVMMQAQNAMLCLGQITDPRMGQPQVNIPLAKMFIDQLSVIRAKTAGNLSAEEQKVIDGALEQMELAFVVFIVAGVSDAVDGFLAKRFNMTSELGALLDPLADKALLVSIYIALGIWGAIPHWLVILVVSRDFMIVAAVIVSWLFERPVAMKPSMVSKLNTVAQVAFAALVLASLGFEFKPRPYDVILMGFVTIFTLSSVSLYLVEWVRHMSTIEAR